MFSRNFSVIGSSTIPAGRGQSFSENLRDKHCLALFFLSNLILWFALKTVRMGLPASINSLSLAEVLGIFTTIVTLSRLGPGDFLTRRDYLLLSLSALLFLYPRDLSVFLSLTLVGALLKSKKNNEVAAIGEVSLGFAWILYWGNLVLQLFQPWLMPFETWIGFLPLSLFGKFSLYGNAIHSLDGPHGVVMGPPCSAFNNTIKTAFIWLCLIKLYDLPFRMWQFFGLLISLVIVVSLNTIRLVLMAYSESGYLFWHDGIGAPIIAYSMLILVLITFYFFQTRSKPI